MSSLPHLERVFPLLAAAGYEKTSEATGRPPKCGAYNCIAWAAGDPHRWWWPDSYSYWPRGIQRETTVLCFVKTFRSLGYRECRDSRKEFAFDKVALYAIHTSKLEVKPPASLSSLSDWEPTHMARQLRDGTWTSKAGAAEDLTHFTLDAVESYIPGLAYGCPVLFMKRFVLVSWIVKLCQCTHWKLIGSKRI